MKRTEIREQIFKLLFQVEFNEISEMDQQMSHFFDDEDNNAKEKDMARVKESLESILEILPEIDAIIEENTEGWTISRIGKAELAILRLAVYEIKYDDDIPEKVAIDEAVELSKKYGQSETGAFVNGILAKVVKQD